MNVEPTIELAESVERTAIAPFAPVIGSLPSNCVRHGDCLQLMAEMPDKSVDAVITDPPYGVTANEWDVPPDWVLWWNQVCRICKGVVVMTAQQPFATDLINSNRKWFRYDWVWDRLDKYSGFLQAATRPLRRHELVLVFAEGKHTYNPQMMERKKSYKTHRRGAKNSENYSPIPDDFGRVRTHNAPCSIIEIRAHCTAPGGHPTRKPVPLMQYLVSTYTNPGELVLDPFCGGGATLVAAKNVNRRFVGMEKESKYVALANRRLAQDALQLEGEAENIVQT